VYKELVQFHNEPDVKGDKTVLEDEKFSILSVSRHIRKEALEALKVLFESELWVVFRIHS
jgi:hypothetical protein